MKVATHARLLLVWAGLGLIALGLAFSLGLHVLEPGLDPLRSMVSDYDDTRHKRLILSTYVAMGAGCAIIGGALAFRADGDAFARACGVALAAAGFAFVALAEWSSGPRHLALLYVGQAALLVAVGIASWGGHARAFGWAIGGSLALGLAQAHRLVPWPGLIQRAYFLLILAWVVVAALSLGV